MMDDRQSSERAWLMSGTSWNSVCKLPGRRWTCGHCGGEVGGEIGMSKTVGKGNDMMYVCPSCDLPTLFLCDDEGVVTKQIPAPPYGRKVAGLPDSIGGLYDEMRACLGANANTSAVLSARKLLMHIAVDKGAEPNMGFAQYVDWIEDNGLVPYGSRGWVDKIRKAGNKATHEIPLVTREDAERTLYFCETLLVCVYEANTI